MSKVVLPHIVQTALEQVVGLGGKQPKWEMLATKIGISPAVLRNKVAAAHEEKRHHLSFAEALAIIDGTQDYKLLHAVCSHFSGEFLQHPGLGDVSNEELLSRYTSMMKELGQFSTDIHVSLIDGLITQAEIETLRKDFLRLTGSLSEMMDRLQEKADKDSKPKEYQL